MSAEATSLVGCSRRAIGHTTTYKTEKHGRKPWLGGLKVSKTVNNDIKKQIEDAEEGVEEEKRTLTLGYSA